MTDALIPNSRLNRKAAVKLSLRRNSPYQRNENPGGGNAIECVGLNDVATITAIGPSKNR